MPTADGQFKGIAVPADAWERVFGERDFLDELIEDYTAEDPNFPTLLSSTDPK